MDYVMIAVGMFSYAIGWMIFLLPNHIGNGGVAGFASIVNWGQGIPVSYTYFVLNAILLGCSIEDFRVGSSVSVLFMVWLF